MRILDAVTRGFILARQNKGLLGLVFAINGAVNLIGFFTTGGQPLDAQETINLAALLPVALFSLGIAVLVQGGLIGSMRDLARKQTSGVGQFVTYAKKFFVRLACLDVLIVLLVGGAWIFSVVVGSIIETLGGGQTFFRALGSLVTIVGALFGVMAVVGLLFASYMIVSNDTKVFPAMRASLGFVRPQGFKVLGLAALVSFIWMTLLLSARMLVGSLGGVMGETLAGLVDVVVTSLVLSGLNVFNTGVYMTYYLAGQAGPASGDVS